MGQHYAHVSKAPTAHWYVTLQTRRERLMASGCHATIPTHYNTMHDVGEFYTRLASEIDTLSAMLFLVGEQPLVEAYRKACTATNV